MESADKIIRSFFILSIIVIVFSGGTLPAAEYTWNSAGTENWTNPSSWTVTGTGSPYPGIGDTAVIAQGTVRANDGSGLNYYIDSNINLSGTGTLTSFNPASHLLIGSNTDTNPSVVQTGGTFSYSSMTFILACQINADWDISGGNFTTTAAYFGVGAGKTGTFNISENAKVSMTSTNKGYLQVGSAGGTGIVNMTGGAINITGGQHSGIMVGGGFTSDTTSNATGGGGTGYFNMSGGTITGSGGGANPSNNPRFILGYYIDSVGYMTMTDGTISNLGNLTIGQYGTGKFDMLGGNIEDVTALSLGYRDSGNVGTGTLDMSGGTITAEIIHNGRGGNGTINISGGTLNATSGIQTGYSSNAVGTFNHTGGAVVTRGLGLGGNGGTGYYTISGDARLTSTGTLYAFTSGTGYLHIIGSKAQISTGDFNGATVNGDLHTKFTIDEYGVSTIYASGIGNLKDDFIVEMPGNFISLQVDHLDLVVAETDMTSFVDFGDRVDDQTPFAFKKNPIRGADSLIARLELNDETLTWNMNEEILFRYEDGEGLAKGALKLEGNESSLLALFTHLSSELAPLLVDYLNDGMANPGLRFVLQEDGTIWLMGSYLNEEGYAVFGWDLEGFNTANDSEVKLLGFRQIPEPATWLLLLAGTGASFFLRRRKRK